MTYPLKVLIWGTALEGPCAYSPTDLAWAAGFIDGEGCIQLVRSGRGMRAHVLRVSVPQVHRAPLDRLAAMFGGGVHAKQTTNPRHRQQHVWEITSHHAASMLRAIRPYLMVKAAEADLAVIYVGSNTTRQGRRKTDVEIAEAESVRLALIEAHHFTEGGDANEYDA